MKRRGEAEPLSRYYLLGITGPPGGYLAMTRYRGTHLLIHSQICIQTLGSKMTAPCPERFQWVSFSVSGFGTTLEPLLSLGYPRVLPRT